MDAVGEGSALATSNTIERSTLTADTELVFPDVLLPAGNYVVMVEFPGGDINHQFIPGVDTSSPTHYGNSVIRESNGVWTPYSNYDTIFYIYGY